MPERQIITVAQLNAYVKELLDQERLIPGMYVRGEISNYRPHPSGHMYFTLKDADAAVSAVMFRSDAARLRFRPENGMQVLALGRVSVFVKSGQYQLYVSELRPDGVGDLYAAFELQKEKLGKEGLFDPAHKKPLPAYPERVALVTAPSGAAVRDMIRILRARWPAIGITVLPVLVQGPDAAEDIAAAIRHANEKKAADVLIVGRGGGSAEDLWAFNEEAVARAIYASEIPVISGVGHEPDVTIADLTADLRASTPSNAAELAVPDRAELSARLSRLTEALCAGERNALSRRRTRLSVLREARVLESPRTYLNERREDLDHIRLRLADRMGLAAAKDRQRLGRASATLQAVSPLAVLGRGYAIAEKTDGRAVRRAEELAVGEELRLRLGSGRADCRVERIGTGKDE